MDAATRGRPVEQCRRCGRDATCDRPCGAASRGARSARRGARAAATAPSGTCWPLDGALRAGAAQPSMAPIWNARWRAARRRAARSRRSTSARRPVAALRVRRVRCAVRVHAGLRAMGGRPSRGDVLAMRRSALAAAPARGHGGDVGRVSAPKAAGDWTRRGGWPQALAGGRDRCGRTVVGRRRSARRAAAVGAAGARCGRRAADAVTPGGSSTRPRSGLLTADVAGCERRRALVEVAGDASRLKAEADSAAAGCVSCRRPLRHRPRPRCRPCPGRGN